MIYSDGRPVRVGDSVTFDGGVKGVVVCSIDDREYSANYPENEWSYLKKGILVDTKEMGVVHLEEMPSDLERASAQ